jgi:hypothetical protein
MHDGGGGGGGGSDDLYNISSCKTLLRSKANSAVRRRGKRVFLRLQTTDQAHTNGDKMLQK